MSDERKQRGYILKDARIQRGMTQMELAQSLSYSSAQFVSNWERGHSDVAFEILPDVCEILQIPRRVIIDSFAREKQAELEAIFDDKKVYSNEFSLSDYPGK